jgi:hypothetical protein
MNNKETNEILELISSIETNMKNHTASIISRLDKIGNSFKTGEKIKKD